MSTHTPEPRASTPVRGIAITAGILFGIGTLSRLAPLFDQGGRLLRQFPTEDGYLMMTIARNLALGHGMSTAAGTIPTNGTQPLATVLWSGLFALVGGDKEAGVALVLVAEILIAVLSAWLLYRLAIRVAGDPAGAAAFGGLAAAGWYASPLVVRHGMNGLETGLYVTVVLGVLGMLHAPTQARGRSLGFWAGIGTLLGLAFLARNDAVFLCGAVGVVHLLGWLRGPPRPLGRRVAELSVAAAAALAVASPWLLHNILRFGHPVPISGQSQSLGLETGANLPLLGPTFFEYASLYLLIPSEWEPTPWVGGLTALAVAVFLAGLALRLLPDPRYRGLLALGGIYVLSLAVFYGVFFRAPYFLSRYLFPSSIFLALAWAAVALAVLRAAPLRGHRLLTATGLALVVALSLGLNGRLYAQGTDHGHFQVVEWVEANVPEDTWVAAIQTGTLGFFHDRTINLDGKVNPEALAARRRDAIPEYVVSKPIAYLADWLGIASWIELPTIASQFELLVHDEARNLAVLRRVGDAADPALRSHVEGGGEGDV